MQRRNFLIAGSLAALAPLVVPAVARAAVVRATDARAAGDSVRHNISAFGSADWRDHFDTLAGGAILADTTSRALHYWSEDESIYRLYPTSVPISDELTRRGYTEIVRKVEGPTWRPTPSMRERDPSLPVEVGPGPRNPLGSHALYLSWQYYRIHGTHDTRKIGRRSSDGCIGLYNEKIAELYALAQVGTQVKLI